MATADRYISFEAAYQFLNKRLFDNKLEACVITFNCDGARKGYFVKNSCKEPDESETRDEIALNPDIFAGSTDVEILSTLAHEMVHKWQYDFGKPGKNAYHNKEWAKAMKRIGLKPFNIIKPDRETGPVCSHAIMADGLFAQVCQKLTVKKIRLNRQLQKPPCGRSANRFPVEESSSAQANRSIGSRQ